MKAWFRRSLGRLVGLMVGVVVFGVSCGASAQVQQIPSTPTTISGSSVRLISYRHQYHMWQTQDGVTHVIANVGMLPSGNTLRMFSSFDNGITWQAGIELPASGEISTSDGFLAGNNLYVTYATGTGSILFSWLAYNPTSKSWVIAGTETAYQSGSVQAINPTIARDGSNRYWIAFTAQSAASNFGIKLVYRASATPQWQDSGLIFGPVDSASNERSARVIPVAGGVGMVYTVHQNMYWAMRSNSQPENAAWTGALFYTNVASDNDPYGSHFSVDVDSLSNVHVSFVDGGQLFYARFVWAAQKWGAVQTLTRPANVAYMQTLASGPNLLIVFNNKTNLGVFQSADSGKSWTLTQALIHPVDGADYSNPRMEGPSNVAPNPLPLIQQYVDGAVQRAIAFQVPAVTLAP